MEVDTSDSQGGSTFGSSTTGPDASTSETSADTTSEGTTSGDPVCGDAVLQGDEECDDGNPIDADDCTNACEVAICGDEIVKVGEEECDDGNSIDLDGCSKTCKTPFIQFSTGHYQVCVAFKDGNARCWGQGDTGGLGYGDTTNRGDGPAELPTPNLAIGGKVRSISAGWYHRCAVLESGAVRCWGKNNFGQLGYGHIEDQGDQPGEMPTDDLNLGNPVTALGSGANHACAIVDDSVRCWGQGLHGQLGYGNTANVGDDPGEMPPPPVPGLGGIVQLMVGQDHNCVLLANDELRCWGRGFHGVLGHGNSENIGDNPNEMPPAPTPVPAGDIVQISGGNSHTCLLLDTGKVHCWGAGDSGQLGYEDAADMGDQMDELPTSAVELGDEPVVALAAGYVHTCGLLATGAVKCWGSGSYGGLGIGTTDTLGNGPDDMPPPDAKLGAKAVALSARHAQFTCALLENDTMRCWGLNTFGNLGLGHTMNIGDNELPSAVSPVPF